MLMPNEQALQVGETVMLNYYDAGAKGVIVELLNEDYVLVKWSDFSTPTVHSNLSLRRVGNAERPNQRSSQPE
jgi:hypothetical protein